MPDKHAFAAALELNGIRTKQNNESRTNLKENKDEHQEGSSQVSLHSENNSSVLVSVHKADISRIIVEIHLTLIVFHIF